MADEKDLEKAKAAAAAKAKAAAAAKAKAAAQAKAAASESESSSPTPVEATTEPTTKTPAAEGDDLAAAKAKAIAAAKAKAAAAAKAKAAGGEPAADTSDDPKAAAIAAAKAKAAAAAAAKAKAAGVEAPEGEAASDNADDAKAKAIAAAKAKAAAVAAAKAKAAGASDADAGAPVEEEKPSRNRPTLDLIVKKITDTVGTGAIEESYINFLGKEVPTLVIAKNQWLKVAELLYNDEELDFKYLSNLHGTDYETHMEVYYYLQSYSKRHMVAIRVKTERDGGKMPSVTSLWYGANWQEREAYDLLGIEFEGHPNMVRMFLPEIWVGHPLRKDYVQFDEEV